MLTIIDTWTGDELQYEDIEDFRETSKHSFDEEVHDVIDMLADAYKSNEPTYEYEALLSIEIQ